MHLIDLHCRGIPEPPTAIITTKTCRCYLRSTDFQRASWTTWSELLISESNPCVAAIRWAIQLNIPPSLHCPQHRR